MYNTEKNTENNTTQIKLENNMYTHSLCMYTQTIRERRQRK